MMDLALKIATVLIGHRESRSKSQQSRKESVSKHLPLSCGVQDTQAVKSSGACCPWQCLLSWASQAPVGPEGPCNACSSLVHLSTPAVTSDHALCSQISPPISLHQSSYFLPDLSSQMLEKLYGISQDDALKTAEHYRKDFVIITQYGVFVY